MYVLICEEYIIAKNRNNCMIEETQVLITNTFCSKDWMNILIVETAYTCMILTQTTVVGTLIRLVCSTIPYIKLKETP